MDLTNYQLRCNQSNQVRQLKTDVLTTEPRLQPRIYYVSSMCITVLSHCVTHEKYIRDRPMGIHHRTHTRTNGNPHGNSHTRSSRDIYTVRLACGCVEHE